MKINVHDILSQPMDRKMFIKKVGALGLVVIGLHNILNVLNHKPSSSRQVSKGYGNSAYGQ